MTTIIYTLGDTVTLSHPNGSNVKGVLADVYASSSTRFKLRNMGVFHSKYGWAVTDVKKQPPPEGTYVRLTTDDRTVYGVVIDELHCKVINRKGNSYTHLLDSYKSWEVAE